MALRTKAAKRSNKKKKKPHGNKNQVRPTRILSKPILAPVNMRAKGLSLDKIAAMMPARPDVMNAKDVRTLTQFNGRQYPRLGKLPKKGNLAVVHYSRTDDDQKTSPRYHQQLIYARDPEYNGKLKDCEAVVVSCSCERWKYMWEYALWRKGAAEIRHSNGEPPLITNKRMRKAACKHIFRLRKALNRRKW